MELFHTPDTAPDAPNKGSNTRSKPAGLGNQVAELAVAPPGAGDLLPTPVTTDALGARNSTAWRSNPDHGVSVGDTLTDAMWVLAAERGEIDLPVGPTRRGLLPTPTTLDHVEKRTTHAGGNATLQGAVCGTNPVDAERLGLRPERPLLPTPVSSDHKGSDTQGEWGRKSPGLSAVSVHFGDGTPGLPPALAGLLGGTDPVQRDLLADALEGLAGILRSVRA